VPNREAIYGHYRRDFKAKVEIVTSTQRVGDDNRPVDGWGESLTQEIIYNGVLQRAEGRFRLLVEWVDVDGKGHRFAVPHEVVMAIKNATDRIMKDSRSDRAKRGAETRALTVLRTAEGE
jgi:hypothetical protein